MIQQIIVNLKLFGDLNEKYFFCDIKKYSDPHLYQQIEDNIYKDLSDTGESYYDDSYRIAIAFELEEDDNFEELIEDILDKYLLHVSDFLDEDNQASELKGIQYLELGGTLDNIKNAHSMSNNRVFNRELIEEGKIYIELVIEEQ